VTETLLTLTSAWCLAGIFAVAVRHKITTWPRFCANLAAYELVPERGVKVVAGLLVVAETAALIGLLTLTAGGFLLAASLLMTYLAAIGINIARGRTQIDCGCGDEPTGLSSWLLLRNAMLISIALWGTGSTVILSTGAVIVGVGLSAVALVLYLALDQMITNHALHRRLYTGEV
jgi:hypothetical protein